MAAKILVVLVLGAGLAAASPSAQDVLVDMYKGCLKDFSVGCVKPKAMQWITEVSGDEVIRITEDLEVVKDGEIPAEVCVILFYLKLLRNLFG